MSDPVSDLTAGAAFVVGWILASAWTLTVIRLARPRGARDTPDDTPDA